MDKDKFYTYIKLKWSSPRTADEYRHLAKRIERYWEGDKMTQETINNFQAELQARSKFGRLNCLYMAFLKHYIECYEDDCEDAGMRRIKIIKPASRSYQRLAKYKFLTKDEINLLLKSITDPYLKLVTRLMFETGLRVSELLNIKASDIDINARTIRGVGKGNKEFLVRFSTTSRANILAWQKIGDCIPEWPFQLTRRYMNPHSDGSVKSAMIPKAQRVLLWKRLSAHMKKIGFRHISPHQLRHSFGHYLRRDLGMDLMQIKTAMRHASVTSTQIYAPADEAEVAQILEEKMLNKRSEKQNP